MSAYNNMLSLINERMDEFTPVQLTEWIRIEVERAYQHGWMNRGFADAERKKSLDILRSAAEDSIMAGIKNPDHLSLVYSKERGFKK